MITVRAGNFAGSGSLTLSNAIQQSCVALGIVDSTPMQTECHKKEVTRERPTVYYQVLNISQSASHAIRRAWSFIDMQARNCCLCQGMICNLSLAMHDSTHRTLYYQRCARRGCSARADPIDTSGYIFELDIIGVHTGSCLLYTSDAADE